MDTYSFIAYIKTEYIYPDIAKHVEKRFDTQSYELERPLQNGENKKVIRVTKDELGGKIMTKFAILRPKT